MPISLKDENIYNDKLARIFTVTQEGISPDDLEQLKQLAQDIVDGKVDVIALIPAPGTQFNAELNAKIVEQLNEVFKHLCVDEPFEIPGRSGIYSGLHVDGQLGPDRKYLSYVDIRVHINPGNHPSANLPEGATQRDFDPYFIFGRVRHLEVWPETLTQSYETFQPTLAINLRNPVWNIFRANGCLRETAPNVPVTHAVVPRTFAEDVLDPEAQFTPLANGDYQAVRANGHTQRITPFNENPFRGEGGVQYGVSRTYDLVNYPVGPSRNLERGLVA